jgi:hypothetical protein
LIPEDKLRERVLAAINGLMDYGDLIEISDDDGAETRRLVALAAPAVVRISQTKLLLVGVTPEGTDPLPKELLTHRSIQGFARTLDVEDSRTVMSRLRDSGYLLITENEWGLLPAIGNSATLIDRYRKRLLEDVPVGTIEGLEILLPERKVTYYPDRWIDKNIPDGDFIARRSRRFGENAWCHVRIRNGTVTALTDLPTKDFRFRACDEAWHLQQAIDKERGTPQEFRVTDEGEQSCLFEFFSPVPLWAHRQWNLLGEHTSTKGALFSYRFPAAVADSVKHFAESRMWLVCA